MTTLRVTVQGETFTVEVLDPLARPVVVLVEGERFEVWPEAEQPAATAVSASAAAAPAPAVEPSPRAHSSNGHSAAAPGLTVLAPLPGVVVSVSVKPGDSVTVGQELLAIEAMKMKNVIRASRAGSIASVQVTPGQSVQPKQLLVEYQ